VKTEFSKKGIHKATQTPLFIGELATLDDLERAELPTAPMALFLATDTRTASVDDISRVAERFLNAGVRYVCAWGPDCERVHDIFDETYVGYGNEPYKFDLMTTWHANDSFGEALSFFLNSAYVGDDRASGSAYAIRIGNPCESLPLAEAISRIEEFQSD